MPLYQLMPQLNRFIRTLINVSSSRPYKVEGDSMLPALAGNEYVLLSPSRNRQPSLHRGDIVVLRNPAQLDAVYVKRIVGLPDEEIRLEGGLVYLNSQLLEESYATISPQEGAESPKEWRNGPDEYFVLGDNRKASQDSRSFGPVSKNLIVGRVWFRYWPLRAWGPVHGASDRSG
ncbi:MAG: signal peptidase I [Chloroflexi bacterium]|nr:signal peptidase I [Chloroflexota bacterium]